jgi:hypothetical protein
LQLPQDKTQRTLADHALAAALRRASIAAAAPAAAHAARAAATTEVQLSTAAEGKQQLQLLPLQSFSIHTQSTLLLQELAASCSGSLTRLETGVNVSKHQGDAQAAAAVVLSLTALRSLSLTFSVGQQCSQETNTASVAADRHSSSEETLLSAVAQLSHLTQLQLQHVNSSNSKSQELMIVKV